MHRRVILAALLLNAGFSAVLAHQSSTAGITMRGKVGAAALIAPSENNSLTDQHGVAAQLFAVDGSSIIVRLTGSDADRASRVRVRLLIRSNTDYEVRAGLSGRDASPAIAASVASIRSTGSGVMPSAVSNVQSIQSAVELSGETVMMASGTRISRGGAASPSNAIEIEIVLEVEPSFVGWSKDVLVAIRPR